jgi:AAA+ ATPase superfamily predicted ATPase
LYFDPRPKTKRVDLFNREEELKQFQKALGYASFVVVTGLRRSGKTSFVDVALAEAGCPHVFLDMRDLPTVPSRVEIVRMVEAAFQSLDKKWLSALKGTLTHVKGVSFVGGSVAFDWGEKGVDLAELLDKIDSWAKSRKERFLLAFDEIQLVRGDKSIPRLLARVADRNRNTVVVVTGSEVGLLYGFLGFDNPDSPLYGRHYIEIPMHSFSKEQSAGFLKKGFAQVDMSCPIGVMEYAVEKVDGVVGWLTLFGAKCRDKGTCSKELVDEIVDEGGRLARAEALKMVKFSLRYGVILNFLARARKAGWTSIKAVLEAHEKRHLPSSTFTVLLNRLVQTGFVEKENSEYRIADLLLANRLLKDPFKE